MCRFKGKNVNEILQQNKDSEEGRNEEYMCGTGTINLSDDSLV